MALASDQGCVFQREAFMSKLITRLWNDESGATAIEYGLIATGIGIVILTGIGTLATAISGSFTTAAGSL